MSWNMKRPGAASPGDFESDHMAGGSATSVPRRGDLAQQLRRRRVAAHRSEPIDCSACGEWHRDPWAECRPPAGPSDFALTAEELRAEVKRCAARGWQLWELRARFAPETWTCVTQVHTSDQAFSRVREGAGGGS
jgi:hypothetical protein